MSVDAQELDPLDESSGFSRQFLWLAGAGLSLVLFAGIIALSYSLGVKDVENNAVPFIRADGEPAKIKPTDPKGEVFPHQDISVYDRMKGQEVQNKEVLAPSPETPAQYSPSDLATIEAEKARKLEALKQAAQAQQNQQVANTPSLNFNAGANPPLKQDEMGELGTNTQQQQQQAVRTPPRPVASPVVPQTATSKVEEKRQTMDQIISTLDKSKVAPTPAKAVQEQPAVSVNALTVVKKPTATATSSGPAYLQIASLRSSAEAQTSWGKISSKNGDVLSGVGHTVQKADLGEKGTYYRLQVGPFSSKEQAAEACKKLQARSQSCILVGK